MKKQHGGRREPGPGKKLGRPPKPDKKITICASVSKRVAEYLRANGISKTIEKNIQNVLDSLK